MMIKKKYFSVAVFVLLTAQGPSAWSDTIDILGTGDGMGILQRIAEAFITAHPEHMVTIADSIGSSGERKADGNDRNRVGLVARPLKDKEKPYGLVYRPVAGFPVVFFVNNCVDVNNPNRQQVLELYGGKIINWEDVSGYDAGIWVVHEKEDSSMANLRSGFPGFSELTFTTRSKIATTTQDYLNTVLKNK